MSTVVHGGVRGITWFPGRIFGRFLPVAVLTTALVLTVYLPIFFKERFFPGVDDAYITYRYAWNFFQGEGLVWNPGREAVQGYSTVLYVLALVPGFFIYGHDEIYEWSFVLNLACYLATIIVLYSFAKKEHRLGQVRALCLILLFSLIPTWSYWVWTGMETVPVALIQVLIWMMMLRVIENSGAKHTVQLAIMCILMILARADGFLMPVLAVVYLVLAGKFKPAAIVGVATISTFICLSGWQAWYYGDWLPNTVAAKSGGNIVERVLAAWQLMFTNYDTGLISGVKMEGFFLDRGVILLFLLIGLSLGFGFGKFLSLVKTRDWNKLELVKVLPFGSLVGLCWLGYWFFVGGDCYLDRFLVFLWPICLYEWFGLLPDLKRLTNMAIATLVVVVIGLMYLSRVPFSSYFGYNLFVNVPRDGGHLDEIGRELNRAYPGKTVALGGVGIAPYYAPDVTFLDVLGLNDRHIGKVPIKKWIYAGHNKRDAGYVLREAKPDIILTHIVSNNTGGFDFMIGQPVPFEDLAASGYYISDSPLKNGVVLAK